MWSKLIMTLSLALGVAVFPQFIGLEVNDALTLNYKNGDLKPVVYYLSVRNTGAQQANFYIKTDVDWVFVYREGYNNSISVRIFEGGAVNFVLEIHPELVSDGTHKAKITITADHLLEPITFSTKEVALTFNKNVTIATVSATPTPSLSPAGSISVSPSVIPTASITPTVSIKPGATPTPTATSKMIKQTLTPTPRPTVFSPSPSITKTPSRSSEIKTGEKDYLPKVTTAPDSKSIWRVLRNIFGWFF